jgi:Ca2+-binding RTX toxin-like protein
VLVYAGQGDDQIGLGQVDSSEIFRIDGGSGRDTLFLNADQLGQLNTLDLTKIPGRITDIEVVDLGTLNGLTFDVPTLINLTGAANTLIVKGIQAQAKPKVTLTYSGWSKTGENSFDGGIYDIYQYEYEDGTATNIQVWIEQGGVGWRPVLSGTAADDVIPGTGDDDNLGGEGGNDSLFGAAGDDDLEGGEGDDLLVGGTGDDTVVGGPGDDILAGDGTRLEFVGEHAYFENILGYIDTATNEATVVLANTATEEAAGFAADLAVPDGAVWFLIPNGHRLNPDVEAGGGYGIAIDGENGLHIEDAEGKTLLGTIDHQTRPSAYFSNALLNADGQEHVRMDTEGTMAWEDLWNLGDNDFNDAVFDVSALEEGADTFILALGEGTDTIVDFEPGSDLIGLRGGIGFDDLTLREDGNGHTEIVAHGDGEEVLAVLYGVSPDNLDSHDLVGPAGLEPATRPL